MSSRPPVRRAPDPEEARGGFWARWWARWWASPVNKGRVIAPIVILLIYFLFLRD